MGSGPARKTPRSAVQWIAVAAVCVFALVFVQNRSKHGSTARPKLAIETDPLQADCGTWQSDYIKLHKDILSGKSPPRYAVSVSLEAGTADR